MRLWSLYQQEKYGYKSISRTVEGIDVAIIIYGMFDDRSCIIDTLFVEKAFRNQGIGKELEKEVIDKEHPLSLHCQVDLTAKNAELIMRQFYDDGYRVLSSTKEEANLYKIVKEE